jgi:replication fork clamp-binding protein CrfC
MGYKKTPTTAWTTVQSGSFVIVAAGDGGVVALGLDDTINVLKGTTWVTTDGRLHNIAVTNGFLFGVNSAGTPYYRILTSF